MMSNTYYIVHTLDIWFDWMLRGMFTERDDSCHRNGLCALTLKSRLLLLELGAPQRLLYNLDFKSFVRAYLTKVVLETHCLRWNRYLHIYLYIYLYIYLSISFMILLDAKDIWFHSIEYWVDFFFYENEFTIKMYILSLFRTTRFRYAQNALDWR